MARNSEKRLTGLNRFLEAKQKEERKDVKRPPLYQLHSAEDVKKWIPSIKKEIEYLLQQVSGRRNYPDRKIEEFKSRVDELKREHGRFVSKVRSLDPNYNDFVPWELRGYQRKRPYPARVESESLSCDSHVISKTTTSEHESLSCDSHAISKGSVTTTSDEAMEQFLKSDDSQLKQELGNTVMPEIKRTQANVLKLDYSSSESSDSSENDDGNISKRIRRTSEL